MKSVCPAMISSISCSLSCLDFPSTFMEQVNNASRIAPSPPPGVERLSTGFHRKNFSMGGVEVPS